MKLKTFLSIILIGGQLFSNGIMISASENAEAQGTFFPTPARPSDLLRIQPDAEEELLPVDENYEQKQKITGYENLIYTAFIIPEEDVEAFLEFVNTDEDIINRIEVEEINSEEYDGQAFIAKYRESASEDGQPILFSAHTQYETIEEAGDFAKETLTIYPDLFFDFEIYEVDGLYDILLGIRSNVDTTVIWFDDDEEMIQYNATRTDFTYQIEEGEEDPYQEIIKKTFPGEFEFDSEIRENNLTEVTMMHVNSAYDQAENNSENLVNSEQENINENEIQEDDIINPNTEETSNSLLKNDNDFHDETESSESSQSVEQNNSNFLGFRDNIISFLNDRNITSDNALIYLIGGFVLLIGLLLFVVGKR